jgi:glycosyltransferase involved in cell wall biosynthesis
MNMNMKTSVKAIHQFAPTCCKGDGITNGMFFTRELLRELGFESHIYCELILDGLDDEVFPLEQLMLTDTDVLFVHHSLGYANSAWLEGVKAQKILIYHNITPPEFLPDNGLPDLSMLGRQQLFAWTGQYRGAIGDSAFNCLELIAAHYSNIQEIPLLVDLERVKTIVPSLLNNEEWHRTINLLFIGRICENKNQLKLIQLLALLKHQFDLPVRLTLAGGLTSQAYLEKIQAVIHENSLEKDVHLLGKVSDAALVNLFRQADAYISLSEHEGFGMPLIEAMLYDLPVLASATSAIPYTLGDGGLLLSPDNTLSEIANQVKMVLTQPAYRRKIIDAQRKNLERFSRQKIKRQLENYLCELGIQAPIFSASGDARLNATTATWQVEGPFDSSYSLALVNREMARALHEQGQHVVLRSHEGFGDFVPDANFLHNNPDIDVMVSASKGRHTAADVVLRFCFPPHLEDMCGRIKVLHSYCWEETGLPTAYVNEFNVRLDLITVASRFVKKILQDNGVRIPIAVTGLGVDHLLKTAVQLPEIAIQESCKAFRFLHISSCFPRKGVDALLAAYAATFSAVDPVSLIIKTFPNPHNDVHNQVRLWQEKNPEFPHVVIIEEDYSDQQIRGLYAFSHAAVVPSRGEGFGLPIAEAMVFGLPVITTAWGGQTDFANKENAWCCNFSFAQSASHFNGVHSAWAEPDYLHLGSLMREVFHADSQTIQARALRAREDILRVYRWSDVAKRTQVVIQKLEQQMPLSQAPKIGWLSSWNTRCGVASYSSFLTTCIPQERLVYIASHTAERVAYDADNVIRCWTQDVHEDLEFALLEIAERNLGAVVVQYNFGFFPLSALGYLIRRLQEMGVQSHIFFHSTADVTWVDRKVSLTTIQGDLKLADRLYVHGIDDLNRLKNLGLIENVVLFPHGLMPTPELPKKPIIESNGYRKIVIAAYGYLLPHKGILSLIKGFAHLLDQNPGDIEWHLLLVNALYPADISTQELHRCRALIDELNISQYVTMHTNYLEDAESYAVLQQADLVVYPYQQTQESASGAVRFGLASGKPVAVTPLPIFEDVAEAVHTLPGTTPEALAEGIMALMQDGERLAAKARNAKTWMASREWPTLSRRLLNIIDGVANDSEFTLDEN